jgi:transcriptional regulator with XRE-family HTH domain
MTAATAWDFYQDALSGEPLDQPVRGAEVDTRASLWLVGTWQLRVPASAPRPLPEAPRLVANLRAWTGWSQTRLARALGTSHTTVGRILRGRPLAEAHSGDLLGRLRRAHEVIGRIYYLANESAESTAWALEVTRPGCPSPLEELRSGHAAKAYLVAIETLNPREPGLLTGGRPRRDGAVAALHD